MWLEIRYFGWLVRATVLYAVSGIQQDSNSSLSMSMWPVHFLHCNTCCDHRCMEGCVLGTSQPSFEPESKARPNLLAWFSSVLIAIPPKIWFLQCFFAKTIYENIQKSAFLLSVRPIFETEWLLRNECRDVMWRPWRPFPYTYGCDYSSPFPFHVIISLSLQLLTIFFHHLSFLISHYIDPEF